MACFLVPMGEAIIVTVVKKVIEKNGKKAISERDVLQNTTIQKEKETNNATEFSWSQKLSWLNKLLWGGVLLLALEHLWHGEIVPWPPFLTAMNNPSEIAPMLHEIATFGITMAVFVTVIWAIMVLVADHKAHIINKEVKNKA